MATQSTKGRKRVKFVVDAPADSKVCVAGTFNDWSPTKNKLRYKDGTWTASLLLFPGRHEYKFVINDVWCVDPVCPEWAPNEFGSLNSVVSVV